MKKNKRMEMLEFFYYSIIIIFPETNLSWETQTGPSNGAEVKQSTLRECWVFVQKLKPTWKNQML